VRVIGLLAAAFLLGSVPFAWLAVRIRFGEDLRAVGSGNPGATNAARRFGPSWSALAFLAIFLLEAGKGAAAAGLLPRLFAGLPAYAPAPAGLAAVLGHAFTPFLRFKGGKGVATTLGVLGVLEPVATGIALLVFAVVFGATRVVGAGSVAVAVALPAAVYLHGAAPPPVGLLAIALGALILVRHRANMARMLRGRTR